MLTLGAVSALVRIAARGEQHGPQDGCWRTPRPTTSDWSFSRWAPRGSSRRPVTGAWRALSLVAALVLLVNHAIVQGRPLPRRRVRSRWRLGRATSTSSGGLLRRMPQTGRALPRGRGVHLRPAPAERLRRGVAPVPEPAARRQSGQHGRRHRHTPRGRRPRAHRGPDRRRVRQGGWGSDSWAVPVRTERTTPERCPSSMRLAVGLLVAVCVVAGRRPDAARARRRARGANRAAGRRLGAAGARASSSNWSEFAACWHPPCWPRAMVAWSSAGRGPSTRTVAPTRRPRDRGLGMRSSSSVTARMQYTATSFAEPVQRVFDDVLRPVQDLDVSHVAESRYVIEAVTFHSHVDDAIERALYRPGHPGGPAVGSVRASRSNRAASTATWPTGWWRSSSRSGRRGGDRMSAVLHTRRCWRASRCSRWSSSASAGSMLLGPHAQGPCRLEGRSGAPILQPLRRRPQALAQGAAATRVRDVDLSARSCRTRGDRRGGGGHDAARHVAPGAGDRVGPLRRRLPAARRFDAARARGSGRGDGLRRNGLESGGHHRRAGRARAPRHDPRPVGLGALVEPPRDHPRHPGRPRRRHLAGAAVRPGALC